MEQKDQKEKKKRKHFSKELQDHYVTRAVSSYCERNFNTYRSDSTRENRDHLRFLIKEIKQKYPLVYTRSILENYKVKRVLAIEVSNLDVTKLISYFSKGE